ncbi:hypothetical protein K435DRAFT_105135 [Dendrothele bispora CBS 962.96]|uniref:EH domain-containing protein n=1 Tax=Dendrothele bispora (strain CBS 962.96) TaxID=1314807 RepID=A0A4S8MST5_DENBC|nr:hypothetical protein K435DRAFT_105135 [Dendrothele bispora CBS 962.96]
MSFIPTPDELFLAERILSTQKKSDVLEPDAAVEILRDCGLSHEVLAEVWNMADEGPKGYLLARDVALALRLIGWAQAGEKITENLVGRSGPLAAIRGFSPETSKSDTYPPLSPSSREKYRIIFLSAVPQNNVLDNQKVVELWSKSGLSKELLSQIWDLVKINGQNYLDFESFCLGMYFIQGLLDKHFISLPETIPTHLSAHLRAKPAMTPLSSPISNLYLSKTSFADQTLLTLQSS